MNPKGQDRRAAEIAGIAKQFGGLGSPVLLAGGYGQSWRSETASGPIVVKPAPHPDEARWIGDYFTRLTFSEDVRVPRPIATDQGAWIVQDHMAWTWIDGHTAHGQYAQKIAAARAFHAAAKSLSRPDFIDRRTDPWAMADRVAWGEKAADYDAPMMAALAPVLRAAKETPIPQGVCAQVIHGDLSGNYVFAEHQAPGIIDLTPYWRPEGFAEAILWVDAIWFSEPAPPDVFARPGMRAFVLRALARRMAEQPEQAAAEMKSSAEALRTVAILRDATDQLLAPWPSE